MTRSVGCTYLSKSKSHYDRPTSPSWCQAPIWDPRPIFLSPRDSLLDSYCLLFYSALSDERTVKDIGCGMPNDGSLLHNGRARIPVGEYPIGVIDHAESPTVAKRDNFEKSIYAGQLRNRLSRSLVVIRGDNTRRLTDWRITFDFELTNIFGTCNSFAVLSVILVNTKLYKKNLDSFLTNILQIQSQAILQELQKSVWSHCSLMALPSHLKHASRKSLHRVCLLSVSVYSQSVCT
jgi:hypothetical protein